MAIKKSTEKNSKENISKTKQTSEKIDNNKLLEIYNEMLLIRKFEEKCDISLIIL